MEARVLLNNFIVRKANTLDIDKINSLVSSHKKELGFLRRVTISNSIDQNELFIAEIEGEFAGMVRYHHRRDFQTTLYDIVVSPNVRCNGVGKALVTALLQEAKSIGKKAIVLKCPAELSANTFYQQMGFELKKEEPGKHRKLNIWHLDIGE